MRHEFVRRMEREAEELAWGFGDTIERILDGRGGSSSSCRRCSSVLTAALGKRSSCKSTRWDRLSSAGGIGPVSRISQISRRFRPDRLPSSGGISPDNSYQVLYSRQLPQYALGHKAFLRVSRVSGVNRTAAIRHVSNASSLPSAA